jgi:hypothetical protein
MNLPSILQGYDTQLNQSEARRITYHGVSVGDLLKHLAERNTEREVQMFLYAELMRKDPRPSAVYRMCGQLSRIHARKKHQEVGRYLARKGH